MHIELNKFRMLKCLTRMNQVTLINTFSPLDIFFDELIDKFLQILSNRAVVGQDEKSAFTVSMSKVMPLQATMLTEDEQGSIDFSQLLTSSTEKGIFTLKILYHMIPHLFGLKNTTN